jgi:hypothetical protein
VRLPKAPDAFSVLREALVLSLVGNTRNESALFPRNRNFQVTYYRLALLTALGCSLVTYGDELNAGETTVDPAYAASLQAEITELPGAPKLAIDGADLGVFTPPGELGIARSEISDVEG